MSQVKQQLQEFLRNLDGNDRARLRAIMVAAFDEYVTELPGPNRLVKSKALPYVEAAIDNFIADWCNNGG